MYACFFSWPASKDRSDPGASFRGRIVLRTLILYYYYYFFVLQFPLEHDCSTAGCQRLKINVSGQHFETRLGVLDRHPKTLLGDRRRRKEFYDRAREELFFDRHRPSFEVLRTYSPLFSLLLVKN